MHTYEIMKKQIISFQEEKTVIKIVDKIAASRGTDRSAIIRECIRKTLPILEKNDGCDC